MRRLYFWRTYLVGCIVCIVYGGWTLFYHYRKGNGLSIHSLILLVIGSVLLILYLILYLCSLKQKSKKFKEKEAEPVETSEQLDEHNEEPVEEVSEESESQIDSNETIVPPKPTPNNNGVTYTRRSSSIYDVDDIYVRKVGYGPVLRVTGARILDMRTNTYYRIQDNMVNQEGSGPAFEISGNKIRAAFGGYLYEISGSNINKIFGGFYASISGNYITLFDLSEKYEMSGSLNRKQLLAVVALLFGTY